MVISTFWNKENNTRKFHTKVFGLQTLEFCNVSVIAGLEKSSVLPVLDRFLSLKTDFVLNRKQKKRSIKVRFFPSNSQ